MTAAICTMVAVLALGAAVQPRPAQRRVAPVQPAFAPGAHQTSARTEFRPGRRRPPAPTAAEVAAWCEGMARVIRSGATISTALRTTEPPASCAAHVDDIVLALRRGTRLADALAGPTLSPHVDLAVTVLRACALNGGPPAEPLDRAAATLRGRAADAAERQTQSAQARLSAVVMTILPVAMLALLLATSPATRAAALTPTGSVVTAIGVALNVAGWRWMRRIISGMAS